MDFLIAMGRSGLFEAWRIVRAGVVAWFYEGMGGAFEYWPEGLGGPMLSEQPPFRNVALMADNDQTYHRIGPIGDPNAESPRISTAAHIRWIRAVLADVEARRIRDTPDPARLAGKT